MHRSFFGNLTLGAAMLLAAMIAGPTRAVAPVTLTDKGTTVVLSNGIISVTVLKSDASTKSLTATAVPGVNILDGSYGYHFTSHVGTATTDNWLSVGSAPGATYSVVTNTPQMVDIMVRNPMMGYDATNFPNGLFDCAVHWVLRAGDSGFYNYWVWRHNATQPAASFNEDYFGGRGNPTLFCSRDGYYAWDFSGVQKMGLSYGADPPGATYINGETVKLPLTSYYTQPTGQTDADGLPIFTEPSGLTSDHFPTWTKKDWDTYFGPYTSFRNTWGMASDQVGFWHLSPSMEWANGGPTKAKGAVSGDYIYMNATEGHDLGDLDNPGVADGQVYSKICGPFFTYVNTGTSHMALWQDAQNRAQQEIANWPYAWVNEPEADYPRQRSVVSGALTSTTGQTTANAVVILSSPPSANWTGPDGSWTGPGPQWPGQGAWMYEGALDYQFWTTADANGRFTIPKVRPGSYTLYSYVPGIFGEFKKTNVTVTASPTTNLGTLAYDPPRRQQQIWQVGTPDHTTGEFRFGNRMMQWGLWWRYMEEMGTNDLNYNIGQSTPVNNWYYAQTIVAVDGGTYSSPKWNVNFTLAKVPTDPIVLTVDIAGGYGTRFYSYVNGKNVTPAPNNYSGWPTVSGADIYRDVVLVGRWQHFELTLPSSAFKVGANTVTITLRQPGFSGTWTGTVKPESLGGGLMYDALKLEAGPVVHAVAGVAVLQGWTGTPQPLTFTLTPTGTTTGGVTTQALTPAADGSFTLPSVPVGTYTLGIKGARWLKKNMTVDTTNGAALGMAVSLYGGDVNGDGVINGADISAASAAFRSRVGDANWNASADVNGDGVVNGADISLISANFRLRSDP